MRSDFGKWTSVSSRMQAAKSTAARLLVTLTLRQGRCTSRKMNRLAVPLRLYSQFVALGLTRRGRDRLPDLADELGRAFVKANDWALRIGRLRIEVEHILHAGDVFAIDLRNAPHVLAPRLEVVFDQTPAHRLARDAVVLGEPDQFVRQQLQGPTGATLGWARKVLSEDQANAIGLVFVDHELAVLDVVSENFRMAIGGEHDAHRDRHLQ